MVAFAHKDIAFEFASWLSTEFKFYLIKEYQGLKENDRLKLSWNLNRTLAKINYRIHTDAIKENIIPDNLVKNKQVKCMLMRNGLMLHCLSNNVAMERKNRFRR